MLTSEGGLQGIFAFYATVFFAFRTKTAELFVAKRDRDVL